MVDSWRFGKPLVTIGDTDVTEHVRSITVSPDAWRQLDCGCWEHWLVADPKGWQRVFSCPEHS